MTVSCKLRCFALMATIFGLSAALAAAADADRFAQQAHYWNRFYLGSTYYPGWWDESRWADDFRKMQELGFNVVRMGDISWSSFEPAEGKFAFEWMDRAIALAAKYGIAVILSTPTSTPPPWLYRAHPDVLGGNEHGPYDFGARKGYSTESPPFLEASDRITVAMAKHFGTNPNIIGWQLDNEPGFPFRCYDRHMETGFRRWLKQRYGTIDKLNQAWFTVFWSQVYNDWSEIGLPALNRADGAANPSQALDYRRFFSDSFLAFLQRQERQLRPFIGDRLVMTNWPNTAWSVDIYRAGEFLDFAAWDNYSAEAGLTAPYEQYGCSFFHDHCRNATASHRFMLAEIRAQAAARAMPVGIRLKNYSAFAHGANGSLVYEWRSPLGGAEMGLTSVLMLDGSFGPAQNEYRRMGKEFARLGPLVADAKTESDIALLYCYDNQWDQGFWTRDETGYDVEALRFYTGLMALKRNIDVVSPAVALNGYRLVAAPGLRIVSDEQAKRLLEYVRQGGVLVLNSEAGTRTPDNLLRESLAPGPFAEAAGISIAGTLSMGTPAAARDLNAEYTVSFAGGPAFKPFQRMQRIDLHGAEVLATFQGGHFESRPAVTVRKFGRGQLVYVGVDSLDRGFYVALAQELKRRFDIRPILNAPLDVEVTSRSTDRFEYIFLLNLTEQARQIELPTPMREMIADKEARGTLSLGPLDVAVLRRIK